MEHSDLVVFIDESGSITKTNVRNNKYFIVAMLFTKNSAKLKRYFKKGLAKLLKKKRYKEILDRNGEIKGSDISETQKYDIYSRIIRNCKDDFELGVIVLDNDYTTTDFIKNHARSFNYIIQLYLSNRFRWHSIFKDDIRDIKMIIDEQNIATDATYTLEGYLNQHLTLLNSLCNHFDVDYVDSKNHIMIQLIDFISNTFYRNLAKNDLTSIQNVNLLVNNLCGGRIFDFSTDHDTELLLNDYINTGGDHNGIILKK